MEIKQIINLSPVSKPTWAKMCNVVKDAKGYPKNNLDDWWYVEVVQWANVICRLSDETEYPSICGCYMESEDGGGGIEFVENWDGHLHYTTKEPAYMDCIDLEREERKNYELRKDYPRH